MSDVDAGQVRRSLWRTLLAIFGVLVLVGSVALYLAYPKIMVARRKAAERDMVTTLHAFTEAQAQYRKTHQDAQGKASYASELPKLKGLLPDGMIAAHGAGGKPYHGYLFREMKTIGGQPIDWATDFALSAIPAHYGPAGGYRSFIVMTNGTIFPKNLGAETAFVDDYPADPGSTLWCVDGADDFDE